MVQTIIQKAFAPVKKYLPKWLANAIRSVATAFLTPIMFSYRTGHFLSSIRMIAVSKNGHALPWYTYPSIDFLKFRSFEDKTVLEFGGGQSTLWWAKRAQRVISLEGDEDWYNKIKKRAPGNVELHYVSMESRNNNVVQVSQILSSYSQKKYDVIIIDGLYRNDMIDISCAMLAKNGIIICDNAEGYGFYDAFKSRGLSRVDFYGNAPGVVLPHCTSIFFMSNSFVFDASIPIYIIAKEN